MRTPLRDPQTTLRTVLADAMRYRLERKIGPDKGLAAQPTTRRFAHHPTAQTGPRIARWLTQRHYDEYY